MKIKLCDTRTNIESISIKRVNKNQYRLYGLMWIEYTKNDNAEKSLVSFKSNNLKWKPNFSIQEECSRYQISGGYNNNVIFDVLDHISRKIFYNFTFENIHTDDVLVDFTILNKKGGDFMEYNIYETLDNYIVKINMAGVKKEDIRVILEDGIIKVKAKPNAKEVEDVETMLETFRPASGETEIYLPNIETVEAKLENGVLILTAPKVSKGVNIDIK